MTSTPIANPMKDVALLRMKRVASALEKNNMSAFIVSSKQELMSKARELMPPGSTVGAGGSVSIADTGILELVRGPEYKFIDRYAEGLTSDQHKELFRQAFFADCFVTSTNAVTEDGWLYNVDGNGNRVAAMLFGPDRVIVVAGKNKIVRDLRAAVIRNEDICGPMNCVRLGLDNPCAKAGKCVDCSSPSRICNEFTVIKRQRIKGRIAVILADWDLGY